MPQTALITGASAGIGFELAKVFSQNGYNVVLTARRKETLEQLAAELRSTYGVQAHVVAADLADPSAPEQLFSALRDENIQVDVLVNNAGFGANGYFAELPKQTIMEILQVNINALVHLSRLFLPGMIERRSGGILNVASTAAFVPGPLMAVYYATKAFVLSFSEALSNEVAGAGVKISCLCPGATATEFQARAKMEKSPLFKTRFVMDAATVARIGFEGFEANKTVVVCGMLNKLSVFSTRFLPRDLTASIARKVQEV